MNASLAVPTLEARAVVHRTRGRVHGPIVRLMSPSDLGEHLKPFVFLDRVDIESSEAIGFGYHPHSGIATLTLLLDGGFAYEDSTGKRGEMAAGAVEWMQAGGGVWHTGNGVGERITGYQLWIALPPHLEYADAFSQYLEANAFVRRGPARVILGEWQGARSPIPAPSPITYLDVTLRDGELWQYSPPPSHDIAWIALHRGQVSTPHIISSGELAIFEEGNAPILFRARGETAFVLGSAERHPHPLVLGSYSVHSSADALRLGEARIRKIAEDLRSTGKL